MYITAPPPLHTETSSQMCECSGDGQESFCLENSKKNGHEMHADKYKLFLSLLNVYANVLCGIESYAF